MINQLLVLWMVLSVALRYPAPFEIQVVIENVTKDKGTLNICIYQDEEPFLKNPLECKRQQTEEPSPVTVTFSGIPEGSYAIYVFHDINKNSSLDRNFFKVPKEPYGFSNNPSTRFGPPVFSKAAFKVSQMQQIYILLK